MMTEDNILKMLILVPLMLLCLLASENYQATTQVAEETVEKVAKSVDKKQLQCLAQNIYYEAGNETTEGKAAVARVVMNRIYHGFGANPCKVVHQATFVTKTDLYTLEPVKVKMCQFSWVCEGKTKINENSARYQKSLQVAYDVLAYDAYKELLPTSVLFFHAIHASPGWTYRKVKQIGNHIFYRK